MCELCKLHGKGTKWYLNPENYKRELGLSMEDTFKELAGRMGQKWLAEKASSWDKIFRMPVFGNLFRKHQNRKIKTIGTQIIPLTDALKVVELSEDFILRPCVCRRLAGKEENTCLHFGVAKEFYEKLLPKDQRIEVIPKDEVKELLTKWDDEGLYHLVVPLETPYIYNICNCAIPYCWAWRAREVHGLTSMLRKGEYVAVVNPELCQGCGKCLSRCPFGAIRFDRLKKVAFVDIRICFGCGLCANTCEHHAITLIDRLKTPVEGLW